MTKDSFEDATSVQEISSFEEKGADTTQTLVDMPVFPADELILSVNSMATPRDEPTPSDPVKTERKDFDEPRTDGVEETSLSVVERTEVGEEVNLWALETSILDAPSAEMAPEDAGGIERTMLHHRIEESLPKESLEIGDYVVMETLGKGGMGIVYKTYHKKLRRVLALKVLREHGEPRESERFEREIRYQNRLSHENICAVLDSGWTEEGYRYLAMEYVEGQSLGEFFSKTVFSPRTLVQIILSVSEALAAAHAQGVIHRDMKPDNIILHPSGRPYVVDFDIARATEREESRLTGVGKSVGTPAYMAPEQVTGSSHRIGCATDIYGLGVILYEGLCGSTPHSGGSYLELMRNILDLPIPKPLDKNKESIDPDLESILLRCLMKNDVDRYESMDALGDDLRAYLADMPVSVHRENWLRSRERSIRHAPIQATVGFIGVILFAAFFLQALAGEWISEALLPEADTRPPILSFGVAFVGWLGSWALLSWSVRRFWPGKRGGREGNERAQKPRLPSTE